MCPPRASPDRRAIAVVLLVVLAATAPAVAWTTASANDSLPAPEAGPATTSPGTSTPTPAPGEVLVVGPEDDAYGSIQAAVDDASDGDTVAVRPGTYREAITVTSDVTLVAPDGATLDGSTLGEGAVAVTIPGGSGAEPTVAGFTVTGYDVGVDAAGTAGAWTARNVTVRDVRVEGVDPGIGVEAADTTGAWSVRNSTFVNVGDAVNAESATGAWTVADSTVRSSGYGIDASHSGGDWTIRNSTFRGNRDGVETWYASGDWTIRNSTFRGNRDGVYTSHSTGAWTIHDSTFRNNTYRAVDGSSAEGNWAIYDSVFWNNTLAVDATGAGGDWEIHGSTLIGSEKSAIFAFGAPTEGDATRNWWGNASGPDVDDCYGQVDCSDHLTSPPVERPEFVDRSDTSRWNATTPMDTTTPPTRTGTGAPVDWPEIGTLPAVGALFVVLLGALLAARRRGLLRPLE